MSMTRQEVLRALADGKEVQQELACSGWGAPCYEFLSPHFDWNGSHWRLKPAPRMVPLSAEDVPPGTVFRHTESDVNWYAPSWVSKEVIMFGSVSRSWESIQKHYTFSRDGGKTWSKCEKEAK